MKKIVIISTLFAVNLLFASHHAATNDCDLKYNRCMGNCSVKYGSDRVCVQQCNSNYEACKIGMKTEEYAPQQLPQNTQADQSETKEKHHEHE